MNDFNLVAPVYDKLCRLVFGRSMYNAQTSFLKDIKPGGRVLILGGGTGWLLSALLLINEACYIWYIEASPKMLELSKKKVQPASPRISFICGTEEDIPEEVTFDAVITHCYLDLFTAKKCNKVIQRIKSSMHDDSIWLITDFVSTTWWHSAMISVLYSFFKVVSNITADALPPWRTSLAKNGFATIKEKRFFGGLICSTLVVRHE